MGVPHGGGDGLDYVSTGFSVVVEVSWSHDAAYADYFKVEIVLFAKSIEPADHFDTCPFDAGTADAAF